MGEREGAKVRFASPVGWAIWILAWVALIGTVFAGFGAEVAYLYQIGMGGTLVLGLLNRLADRNRFETLLCEGRAMLERLGWDRGCRKQRGSILDDL